MSQIRKRAAILLVFALVVSSFAGFIGVGTASAAGDQLQRIAGADRFETAAKIAEAKYPSGSNTVIVARSDDFADGLAASVLAGALNVPVLLTKSNELPTATADAITKLGAKKVIVLGSEAAISAEVETALKNVAGETERIGGADRIETAVKIAQKAKSSAEVAFIVNGWAYADAMTAGSAAFAKGYPVFAVRANELPAAVKDALKALGVKQVVIVGGETVVSSSVAQALAAEGVQVSRIAGTDRIETSVEFSKSQFANASGYSVVNGWNLADAVGAAVFGNPILYTYTPVRSNELPGSVSALLQGALNANADAKLTVLGGPVAVSDATFNQLELLVKNAVFKVVSVSAINAKQIQVVFNKAVERASATSKDNYLIQTNTDSQPVDLTSKDPGSQISLSDDAKTVTITTSQGINATLVINAGTPFVFVVQNVKDLTGSVVAKYTTTLVSDDKVAPTLLTAKAAAKTTTTKVTLEFNEPVDTTGAIAYIAGVAASVQDGTKPNEVVLTSGQALNANQSYELMLLNFKDFAGNFLNPNPTTVTFTVTSDTTAPVVQSVQVVRDNLIEVTFDKAMDVSTFSGNVRVLDLNGVEQGGTISATAKANTGNRTVRLALATVVPFNANGVFTGTLVLGDGIKDIVGNAKVASSHSITITKDTVRPTISAASYIQPGGQYAGNSYINGAIVVKFSEEVAYASSNDVKLITSSGVDQSIKLDLTNKAINTNNPTEAIVPLTGGLASGTYVLRVGNDVVKDLSTQANTNVAATITLKVDPTSDKDKPVVDIGSIVAVPASNQTSGTAISGIKMTDNAGLDLSTVVNVNNYLLNGKPLPAGSYITVQHNNGSNDLAATDVNVTINIPAQSIAKSGQYTLNITNIKDKAGNVADPKVVTGLSLVDDVSPELKGATISSNGLLVLEFTESVVSVTYSAYVKQDFQFVINGVNIDPTKNENFTTFADGTGTDTGKYVVTFKVRVDAGADGNPNTTADNRLYIDVDGSNSYNTGDILLQTGTTKTVGLEHDLDLNLLSSLQVIVANNLGVKDQSTLANPIKKGTTITVK